MLDEIIELHRAGRLQEAEQGYRDLLASEPDDPEVMHLLGILRGQREDLDEALKLVHRAIERDPERWTYPHTLGDLYLHAQRLDEAQSAYQRAKELNPNLTTAHSGLGQIAMLRGDFDSAEQHFRIALRADDNDAQALAGLGNIHLGRGDAQMASRYLSRAAQLNPNDALIQTSVGRAMLTLDMLDFATQSVNNALALKPDYAIARLLLGEISLRKRDFEPATRAFELLLAKGEHVAAAHQGLGDIARLHRDFDSAIGHYEEALRREPGLHPSAIRRADCMAQTGRIDEAIADIRARMGLYPEAIVLPVALAHLLLRRGDGPEALSLLQAAAAREPDNQEIQADLALTLNRAGDHAAAAQHAERAADLSRPELILLRARGSLAVRDAQGALQHLQTLEARPLGPGPTRRRYRLAGFAHDVLGQWQEAVQDFEAAHRVTADSLPALPELDGAMSAQLHELAARPALHEARVAAPILLIGLPGSGVGQVTALLGDQAGLTVRRDRLTDTPDFLSSAFDIRLLGNLGDADLAVLARRYARSLERANRTAAATIIDWLPHLDARMLPAVIRALPGVRIVIVQRDIRDTFLNWLGFSWSRGYTMPDAISGARWLKLAGAQQAMAAELMPACIINADALLEDPLGAEGNVLAAFLGIDRLQPGALAQAAAAGHGGLPVAFAPGHAVEYRAVLSAAFEVLD